MIFDSPVWAVNYLVICHPEGDAPGPGGAADRTRQDQILSPLRHHRGESPGLDAVNENRSIDGVDTVRFMTSASVSAVATPPLGVPKADGGHER